MSIPGFTADHAFYRTDRQFSGVTSRTSYSSQAEVLPQFCVPWGNGVYCTPEPTTMLPGTFPSLPFDHTMAQCRAGCYRAYRGAALTRCLAEC
jgi:hypothetical protein